MDEQSSLSRFSFVQRHWRRDALSFSLLLTIVFILLNSGSTFAAPTLPPLALPAWPANIIAGDEFRSVDFSKLAARHVTVDWQCLNPETTAHGKFYAYAVPTIANRSQEKQIPLALFYVGLAPGSDDEFGNYQRFTFYVNHSSTAQAPYYHENTTGSHVDTFHYGSLVAIGDPIAAEARSNADRTSLMRRYISNDFHILPIARSSADSATYITDLSRTQADVGYYGDQWISAKCLRLSDPQPESELPVRNPIIAVLLLHGDGAARNQNGIDDSVTFYTERTRVQLALFRLSRSLSNNADANIADDIEDANAGLRKLQSFAEHPTMPALEAQVSILETASQISHDRAAYRDAYGVLSNAVGSADPRVALRLSQQARAKLAAIRSVTNVAELSTIAELREKTSAASVAALDDSARRAERSTRARAEAAASDRAAIARARAVAATTARHAEAEASARAAQAEHDQAHEDIVRAAARYKRDQKRLILKFDRMPDSVETIAEDGLRYEMWKWGSSSYVFAPGGVLVREQ